MRSYTLEFDGYDRYSIYSNHFSNRRYPPIPIWKKRFFDPAAFTTRKLKQCLVDWAEFDCVPLANGRPNRGRWSSTNTRNPSNFTDASPTSTQILETSDVWQKHPFLFLSLVSVGLFFWLSASTLQEVEPGSIQSGKTSPQNPDKSAIAGFQFPILKINRSSTSLMAAIDPAKLDAGAILGSGRNNTTTHQPDSQEISLPQMGQKILERLKQRSLAATARTQSGRSGHALMEPFLLPVTGYPLTSPFGNRIHPLFGNEQLHTGIDIGTPSGTPVRAAAGGVVAFAGWDGGYGNLIIISHVNGYETFYAHLDEIRVAAGDRVAVGKVIGLSGSTGYVTGPHLHFEIRLNQVAINPMNYLAKFINPSGLL